MKTVQKIKETEYDGLKVIKLASTDTVDTLLITLEGGHTFPDHTSPRDAILIVLEGNIDFHINGGCIPLESNDCYNFKKETTHHVVAGSNSKFLIIR